MKGWTVKREDGAYLLAKNGTLRLFSNRALAAASATRAKGKASVQRVEITDAGPSKVKNASETTEPKPKDKPEAKPKDKPVKRAGLGKKKGVSAGS